MYFINWKDKKSQNNNKYSCSVCSFVSCDLRPFSTHIRHIPAVNSPTHSCPSNLTLPKHHRTSAHGRVSIWQLYCATWVNAPTETKATQCIEALPVLACVWWTHLSVTQLHPQLGPGTSYMSDTEYSNRILGHIQHLGSNLQQEMSLLTRGGCTTSVVVALTTDT